MKNAQSTYKDILAAIPEFGENDIFIINIISAAMLTAIYLSMAVKPSVEQTTRYYEAAMNGCAMTSFILKRTDKFSAKYQDKSKRSAQKSQLSANPYTWRYTFTPSSTLDSFDEIYDKCGICKLMNTLGIPEIIPAMCAYDYSMARVAGYIFTREYTIAGGDSVCDCHYKKL